MFKNKELMNPDNLLIDLSGPIEIDTTRSFKEMGDTDTRDVYQNGLKIYIKDKEKEIQIPIYFFIDRTHTDKNGRLTVEPVSFTLGIFKQSVRRTAAAWRTIGYIVNQSEMTYKDGCDKAEDYHFILNEILKEFKELQKEPLVWDFDDSKGNKIRKYCWFPIFQIIGDTEGHDKIVCRKAGYSQNHVTFCRICACPVDDTDNPDYKCKNITSKDIENAVINEDMEALDRYGHYPILSAFHDCLFCNPIWGLYGCVCGEHLHVNQQGNFQRTL